ncbi:hypothetical protein BC940DRAFT_302621 [Gongronella butleri]|nr:hypothetical protein BC940DRAFT_302621 [Gongronella butleri]
MENNHCFLRVDTSHDRAATELTQYLVNYLDHHAHDGPLASDPAIAYATRPWVLIFCASRDHIDMAMQSKAWGGEKYLESIRFCYVPTVADLRAILAAFHMKPRADARPLQHDLLSWFHHEKHGQPPALVVVMGLLDLFCHGVQGDERYLSIRCDQLAATLALLTETCRFLGSEARDSFMAPLVQPLGASSHEQQARPTYLVITDHGCLPHMDVKALSMPPNNKTHQSKDAVLHTIYGILMYYLGYLV